MEDDYEPTSTKGELESSHLQIVRYSPFQFPPGNHKLASPWFDLRVFYVRISNFRVDDSTPESLTLHHIPMSPDTLLEVNGVRSSVYSDGVSSVLRRDRADRKSEEATFVSTDSIRTTGNVKFEVFDKDDLILSGVLEMSNINGLVGEAKANVKRWSMNCESEITVGTGFLKGKNVSGPDLSLPTIEVYVTGCFSGTPIILTKTLQLGYRKKHNRKSALDSIPEDDTDEPAKSESPEHDELQGGPILNLEPAGDKKNLILDRTWSMGMAQSPSDEILLARYRRYKLENEEDYDNMYLRRTEYMDGEDGELSWFNAGVRVGVGIGLGICVGVGIGVGLLVRSYQTTTRNFRRRLI